MLLFVCYQFYLLLKKHIQGRIICLTIYVTLCNITIYVWKIIFISIRNCYFNAIFIFFLFTKMTIMAVLAATKFNFFSRNNVYYGGSNCHYVQFFLWNNVHHGGWNRRFTQKTSRRYIQCVFWQFTWRFVLNCRFNLCGSKNSGSFVNCQFGT
jgi:hypothetical protein